MLRTCLAPGALRRAAALALPAIAGLLAYAPATAQIRNTATLAYSTPSGPRSIASNTVSLDLAKTPATLSFRRVPAGFGYPGMACDAASGRLTPSTVTPQDLARSTPLKTLNVRAPVFMVLTADGENRDPLAIDQAVIYVTIADRKLPLTLRETGPDTGVFAGGFPPANSNPNFQACELPLEDLRNLSVSYEGDAADDGDDAAATILIDPEGYVFSSTTGELVDGATITLIDDATGEPAAAVFGDDGVSAYPNTVVSGASVTDASGYTYQFTPGHYRFPLAPPGSYHFRIMPPARYTAPSVATPQQLGMLDSPRRAGGFIVLPASYGQSFVLSDPTPLMVDIPLDPIPGVAAATLVLDKVASVRDASPGEFVQYRLQLTNNGVGATAETVRITDALPQGLRYRVGSTHGAGEPEVSADGRRLVFSIPQMRARASATITYIAAVGPGTPVGEAVNTAQAEAGLATSNQASAAVRIRPLLMTDGFTLTGRVTEGDCGDPARGRTGVGGIRLVLEDGTFVATDKDGLYHVEGVRPGTHVVQIDSASVPATLTPVACDRDTRSAGSSVSRFVEATGGTLARVDFQLRRTGATDAAASSMLPITPADDATAAGNRADWLQAATPGTGWLFPLAHHNPRSPALRVVVRHLPGQRVALSLNGKPVDPISFDGTDSDDARGVAVSRWTGLPLLNNDNRLDARVLRADGTLAETLEQVVHYANVPLHAELKPEVSRLVADGLTRPLLAVRVTDRYGAPVRAGTVVPFRVDQPYLAAQAGEAQQARQLAGLERTEATARVIGDDGIAFVALQPTTQSGTVHLTITLADQTLRQVSDIRARLEAPVRDWMVVGFGRGTIGYDLLRRHARALPQGERNRLTTDGQLALYAKGRVTGRWLLTLAYDSDRRFDRDRGLLGTVDPDRYYTVYGDGSAQGYDAATRGKLYLRLERRAFVALFGDFETGFTDTRLARYSRTLNGFKAEAANDRVAASAFAAHDQDRYARDEIPGNGLSGPYRLSASDIVPNSDKITLETRDRFRSERILSSKLLTRHIDYDIDAEAGTIRFREPVLSRDAGLNPVFIVVDYEVEGPGRKLAAGARAAAKLAGGKAEVGATLLHDEGQGSATVAAIDLRTAPAKGLTMRAEAATGGRTGLRGGTALATEVEYHAAAVDVLGYARRQESGFGVGQQNASEAGTAKIGLDGRVRLTGRLSATVSGWMQDDLIGAGHRTAGEARLEHRGDAGTVFVGTQLAADRGIDGTDRTSTLLTVGGTRSLFDHALDVTGQAQVAIGGRNDSADFPVRQQIGASWRVKPGVRLIGGYEIAKGDAYTVHNARAGFDLAPWAGAHLVSTLNNQAIGENGTRTFAQYGLSQSLPLGKRWSVDATLDASNTLSGRVPAGAAVALPRYGSSTQSGQSLTETGFVAATLGATYRGDRWSWNGRAEWRQGSESDRMGLTSNLLRTLGEGKTLASSIRAYRVRDGRSGGAVTSAAADLALAWRPIDSRWSLLERFELRHEGADGSVSGSNVLAVPTFATGAQTTLRAINNLAINYRGGNEGEAHRVEATLYYGAKYVRGRYADERVDGFIDAVGLEVRRDIRANLDLGVQAGAQHSWSDGTLAFVAGPTVGIAAARDVWISAGYNVAGYRDRDYAEARYTRQGPYLTLRARFAPGLLGLGGGKR